MEALAVDAQLLRAVLTPELNLTVGRSLSVRVAELLPGGRGTLSLAGVLLEAELPATLRAGQELRLVVKEATAERIVLGIQEDAAQVPPPIAAPLPGGGTVHVTERDARGSPARSGADGEVHSVALTYDAPNLGAVGMHFTLDGSSLRLGLTLAAGPPFELAQDSAGTLLAMLSTALQRAVTVTVAPRRDPIDVYA